MPHDKGRNRPAAVRQPTLNPQRRRCAMDLRLWIGNPYLIHYQWTALKAELHELFDPVVKASSKYQAFVPENRKTKPPVMANDLLVYLVPTYPFGFIGRGFGPDGS